MKQDIDTLVTDICTVYPELTKEVASVRALVTELVTHSPKVDIDDTFKARLRSEVLGRVKDKVKPKVAVPWWLIYTVPVGVTAVLLLVVYPNLATAPIAEPLAPMEMENVSPAGSMMKMGGEESADMWSTTMEMGDAGLETSVMSADYFTATFSPDGRSINLAYAILSQSGFVVVSGPEGVVAISELMLPGEQVDVRLPMVSAVKSGVTYSATLYYDNGDGVFDLGIDLVAHDYSGQPVMMPMVAP
ncbi:MAG: hypothetical protein R3B53_02505 [Candidatus Paceibacterota bacterium]